MNKVLVVVLKDIIIYNIELVSSFLLCVFLEIYNSYSYSIRILYVKH